MKYHILNFGCQMNEHDMEKAKSLLHRAGHDGTEDIQAADLVIVNTCCVRAKAEQKFYSLMGRLRSLRRRRKFLLGVTGCIAQLEREALLEKLPFVDFSLGPSSVHHIVEAVEGAAGREAKAVHFSDNGCTDSLYVRTSGLGSRMKAYVTIMKGCDNFCSYCVVPHVRGREVSRQSDDVLQEIRELAASGVREVVLLGQNVNSYNRGRDDIPFVRLLERIDETPGISRVRFVTSHPRDCSEELIGCFGSLPSLSEQIHLPFQSGSNRVLGLMNRGYTVEQYREKVERLRAQCPDIAVTADCIVGFPGEEERDFEDTMSLVTQVRFDGVFSFCFSPRKHTAAAALPGAVPRETAMRRLTELQAVQRTITHERLKRMEGARAEVLVEGMSKNSLEEFTGRTRTNHVVNFEGTREMVGKLVELDIVKGYANSLRGANPQVKEA